jgi:hypothetical protein
LILEGWPGLSELSAKLGGHADPLFRYASFMVAREAPDNESLRLELQEAIAAFHHWSSQFTQMAGLIFTGDVILISYGFSQRLAAILLVACAFPLTVLVTYTLVGYAVTPLVDLILKIERKLQIREVSLGAIYMRVHLRSMAPAHGAIEDLSDEEVRRLNLNLTWQHWWWMPVSFVVYALTVVQVGLFVLSLTVFHYRFM